ncbi:zeta toxin family protein [Martelella radicis]|uniref:Zeta toxin domain-containing protein n=1 Tax=Martelella radicis TaxID=1397476 RepID=A0A7W6PB35_9HYPH|nr:zeta toxin family protein [Martelella radicis]MBB4124012.1 hypothetical protein [Martelella radicis]
MQRPRVYSPPSRMYLHEIDTSEQRESRNIDDQSFATIYHGQIRKRAFAGTFMEQNPRFILLIGQPASGKSYAVSEIKRGFGHAGGVVIDKDMLSTYHPDHYNLFTTGVESPYTDPRFLPINSYADRAKEMLLEEAISCRRNIIFLSAPTVAAAGRLPQVLRRVQNIELWVVATKLMTTRLSSYLRYEKQRAELKASPKKFRENHKDGPRFMTDRGSDFMFNQLGTVMRDISQIGIADKLRRVVIVDREGGGEKHVFAFPNEADAISKKYEAITSSPEGVHMHPAAALNLFTDIGDAMKRGHDLDARMGVAPLPSDPADRWPWLDLATPRSSRR